MSNLFLNLPAGNPGAGVDVSRMGRKKTVIAGAAGVVQVATDAAGTNFQPVVTFPAAGGRKELDIPCTFMRQVGAGNCDVGGNDDGATSVTPAVPAGNGVGAALDIGTLGRFCAVIAAAAYTGDVVLEASEDNVDWQPVATFPAGGALKVVDIEAQFVRVRRQNVVGGPAPVVTLAAANEPGDWDVQPGVNVAPVAALEMGRVYKYDVTAGDIAQILPAAASVPRGSSIWIKAVAGANNVNVTPAAGDTIDLGPGPNVVGGPTGRTLFMRDDVATNWLVLVDQ